MDEWREGAAMVGCWWRIERDQDDGIGVAGVKWRQGEIGWDGWVVRRRGDRSGRMQGAINSEIALARSLLDANIGPL